MQNLEGLLSLKEEPRVRLYHRSAWGAVLGSVESLIPAIFITNSLRFSSGKLLKRNCGSFVAVIFNNIACEMTKKDEQEASTSQRNLLMTPIDKCRCYNSLSYKLKNSSTTLMHNFGNPKWKKKKRNPNKSIQNFQT